MTVLEKLNSSKSKFRNILQKTKYKGQHFRLFFMIGAMLVGPMWT